MQEKPTGTPEMMAHQKRTLHKHVVVEYLNVWFR